MCEQVNEYHNSYHNTCIVVTITTLCVCALCVGRCTSNVLRSPGAEEKISAQNDWKTQARGPVPDITTNADGKC